MYRARLVFILVVLAVTGLVLAGCGDDDSDRSSSEATRDAGTTPVEPAEAAPANSVTITAADFTYQLPKEIPAGPTKIVLENHGGETHQAALVRLADGATGDQFLQTLATDFQGAQRYGTFVAGPNEAAPNASSTVVTDLEPGNYLVLCLIPSPDGTPHVLKGMMTPLVVTEPARPARPVATSTPKLVVKEFSFDLPEGYEGGPLEIENRGAQAHEVVVVGLKDGVTISDIVDNSVPIFTPAKGPAPYTDVAGITPVAPGGTAHLDLDLAPGRYALLCFLPDTSKPGTDHLHDGMATVFTVS
jgi:hypothetical protein